MHPSSVSRSPLGAVGVRARSAVLVVSEVGPIGAQLTQVGVLGAGGEREGNVSAGVHPGAHHSHLPSVNTHHLAQVPLPATPVVPLFVHAVHSLEPVK
jgi:hypothetical protein